MKRNDCQTWDVIRSMGNEIIWKYSLDAVREALVGVTVHWRGCGMDAWNDRSKV